MKSQSAGRDSECYIGLAKLNLREKEGKGTELQIIRKDSGRRRSESSCRGGLVLVTVLPHIAV
jgi:hypothetical protein